MRANAGDGSKQEEVYQMTYFGFIPKGRKYAEVIVTKEQGQRSTQVETGVTFPTFKAAEQAVFEKNMAVTK